MSAKEHTVFVLLEDDIEILGNGQGHVFYRQYLPVVRYIKLLKKYNLKSTFYIDIAHLLFLKENSKIKDYGLQADAIENIILHILKNDMEVQLHLHPQWVDAKMVGDEVQVTNSWNIGLLPPERQVKLVEDAMQALNAIIAKSGVKNSITSFRTGSWGLQPFKTLYDAFEKLGIKTVLGPIKGLKIPALGIDYDGMESDQHPYYCEKSDINKIGTEKGPIVVPMTPTHLNWFDLIRYVFHSKFKGFRQKFDKELDLNKTVINTKYDDPTAGKDKFNLSLTPFKTHLKMNAQPFWFLKNTFKRSYEKVLQSDTDFKLIVIETHSKDFKNTFDDIELFFSYLTKEYENLEYVTANELLKHVNENKLNPLVKKV